MRTRIKYAKDEDYAIYMIKPRVMEKPISFAFLLPEFTDPQRDIRIGFATNGVTDTKIRIELSLDKVDGTVGFSTGSKIEHENGMSFDLFNCFMSHNQIILNFWTENGDYYCRKLSLGNFMETYLRLLE